MCNCNKKTPTNNILRTTTSTNCNGLRKRLINVKNKIFIIYKKNNDDELFKLYQDLTLKLKKMYYCPDYLDVVSLEDEYLNA